MGDLQFLRIRIVDILRGEKLCSMAQFKIQSLQYSAWPATFNGHSHFIGQISLWPFVLTWTTRTSPSWPGKASPTQPRRHWPRGAFWSITSTTSPTFRFYVCLLDWPLPIGAFQGQWNKPLKQTQQVRNPNWQEADQLAMNKRSWGVE